MALTNKDVLVYKSLVELLLHDPKNEKSIKELMRQLGIEYKDDHIDRLSAVLAFDPRKQTKGKINDLR